MNGIQCRAMRPSGSAGHRYPAFFALALVSALTMLARCSMDSLDHGGNSSGTGNNGIVLHARTDTISGVTVPGARVALYAEEYQPYRNPAGFCDSTVADDSGRFRFAGLAPGRVTLIAQDTGSGRCGLISGIPVLPDTVFSDTLDSLRHPGFLQGTAIDSASRILPLAYVFIRGTPFYAVAGNRGEFLLGPLPAGGYRIGFFANFALVNDAKNNTPQLMSLLSEIQDLSVTQVFSDSVSQWSW